MANEEKLKRIAEPEIIALMAEIIRNGDFYSAHGKKALANRFYGLLPMVNDLNRKLKELRQKDI